MADKVVLEAEVKSNIKAVAKDQKAWNKEIKKTEDSIKDVNKEGKEVVAEMQILGLSINGLKAGWKSAASGAKFMFRSIKMGIISTGIGVFVVAFGTLATWFAKTKKGAEFLEVAFTGVGAAINVIVDRIAKFGGGIAKILAGDVRAGLKDMGDSFKGIGKEILTDTLYTMALKKAVQDLADSQRDLNVETAQRRADIEELKLIAEDVTKSEQVRLKAAQDAFEIENNLLDKRVSNAEKALTLEQKRQSTIVDPQKEDLDIIAQLEIDLANIRGESVTKQIELNNKINSIQAEGTARRLAELESLKAADAERMGELTEMTTLFEQNINKRIELIGELAKAEDINFEKKKTIEMSLKELSEKRIEWAAMTENERLNLAKNTLNDLTKIAGEETAAGKALAITAATIDTYQSAQASYKSLAGIPYVGPVLGGIAAAAAVAMGMKNIAAIRSASPSGGGGGGGGGGGVSAPTSQTPAPQMMSGAFDLTGGVEPEPLQAYVLTDEMTNSQNQLANIRRRATI